VFSTYQQASLSVAVAWSLMSGGSGMARLDDPPASSAGESLTSWQWRQAVSLPAQRSVSPFIDVVLTPSVFDRARVDLNDLRLYDVRNREVPFKLEVRHSEERQTALTARLFNQVRNPDRSASESLDLGAERVEHNAIDIRADGSDFRRRVRLEGSDDEKQWGVLFDNQYLVQYRVGGAVIDVHRLTYPASRLRYLRVRVFPEAGNDDDKPTIANVAILHSIKEPGEYQTLPASLGQRQPTPVMASPGSTWDIELAPEATWCGQLRFEVQDADFARQWELSALRDDLTFQLLAQGEWRRRPGAAKTPLEINLPTEVLAKRLRLQVIDDRNKPLTISNVSYTAAVRRLIFARAEVESPLWLYFGDSNAQAPHYDFARNLPETVAPAPNRGVLAEVPENNPSYEPVPKPWTERSPWAIYVILSAACLVLLSILGLLAKDALARADRAEGQRPTIGKV
jgi:Protein of unknown function (DUF3999)